MPGVAENFRVARQNTGTCGGSGVVAVAERPNSRTFFIVECQEHRVSRMSFSCLTARDQWNERAIRETLAPTVTIKHDDVRNTEAILFDINYRPTCRGNDQLLTKCSFSLLLQRISAASLLLDTL